MNINKALLTSYIIVSALFIILSAVNYFKFGVYNVGVKQGTENAINSIIKQSLDTKCQSFSLFSGNTEVGLINVKCLQQAETAPEAAVQ